MTLNKDQNPKLDIRGFFLGVRRDGGREETNNILWKVKAQPQECVALVTGPMAADGLSHHS